MSISANFKVLTLFSKAFWPTLDSNGDELATLSTFSQNKYFVDFYFYLNRILATNFYPALNSVTFLLALYSFFFFEI